MVGTPEIKNLKKYLLKLISELDENDRIELMIYTDENPHPNTAKGVRESTGNKKYKQYEITILIRDDK